MKKSELKAIADKYFKANEGCDTLFMTSDGQAFVNKNAAILHKNTNPSGKKLGMETFTTGVVAPSAKSKTDAIEFPLTEKTVKKLKLPELQKIAEDLKINVQELDTKQKLADAINELKAKDNQ